MRVAIVALGDLGRSPRMCNHALAAAQSGADVDLIGYRGTPCSTEIENHPRIAVWRMRDPLARFQRRSVPSMLRLLLRALLQHAQLLRVLVFATRRPDRILVQCPPALPTLGVAWLAARIRAASLVIDWHNFSSALLASRFATQSAIVRVIRAYERAVGRLADTHFCVSRGMKRELSECLGIPDAIVLYDDPNERFTALPPSERPSQLRRLLREHLPDSESWSDDSRRPACIVCPTSWSEDEDLAVLLEALALLDKRIEEGAAASVRNFPKLLVLITGRGPLREGFERRIAGRAFRRFEIGTAWLPAEDYPRLLAAADLGLCFHRSASGVDLPMKLADMFGAGLPVCALDYGPCLSERFDEGKTGLTFTGSQQLADQLYELFVGFPARTPTLDRLREGLASSDRIRWEEGWRELAEPVLLGRVPHRSRAGTRNALRIGFFHPDLGIGGAERWLIDAASGLQNAGHLVTIVTSRWDRNRCFEATRDGTLEVRVRGGSLPAHIAQRFRAPCAVARSVAAVIGTALRGERYDVVFVDLVPHVIPILRRISRARVVYYCHHPDQLMTERRSWAYRFYRWPIDRLEARAVASADRMLVNSRFTAAAARRVYPGLSAAEPEVLYPGISSRRPAHDGVKRLDRELMLLCVSRFERKKGLRLAIEALAALADRIDRELFERVRLVVAGGYDASLRESALTWSELESLATRLGLSDQIQLLKSPSDDVRRDLLLRCRCVIYTPEAEHFGLVPLEAMAAGRPVIATRSGGPAETILDQQTGLLCDATPAAFADAIARLVSDLAECERMGQAGRDRAIAAFSLDAFSKRLAEIVEEVAVSGNGHAN
jgi:glycosyltransferase involved in cell wall biosynthesis